MSEFNIDQYVFRSKTAAKDYLSEMLKVHAVGDRVTDSQLIGFLNALALQHPNPAEKIGKGISHWVVMRNNDLPDFASRNLGFRIVQHGSDTPIPFSYTKIISPRSDEANFATALTLEALEITRNFRREAFDEGPVYCADTNELISDIRDARAVHRHPGRAQLHQNFLKHEGLSYDQVEIHKPERTSEYRLTDRDLASKWIEFQIANLGGMRIVKTMRSIARGSAAEPESND